ncbi:MAG TPA: FAD-binding oxidoreductase [Steroidobacteraceae bacterium]|nr:FAD-binding oxidoreductase [Steroidobacteraceae bacterium]
MSETLPPTADLLARLRSLAGPRGVLDAPGDVAPWLVDHRALYRGATPFVLQPDSTERVAAILAACHEARCAVVPAGGNTSYCGGATPDASGTQIVLSLARMNRVRSVQPADFQLVAEAGCTLAQVQSAAAEVDRLFPLSLGSEGTCQLGGNLSTNAGGTAVLQYGMARDLVLGLEVVLPDGRVLDELKGLRKDNTGYELKHLFIGAEGTLGVITAACCKLYPQPAARETAFLAVRDPAAAVELLTRLREVTGNAVTTFELIPRIALDMVLRHIPRVSDPLGGRHAWYALIEVSSRRDAGLREVIVQALESAIERGAIADAAIAESGQQSEMFWRLRETIPEAQRHEGPSIKHDVSVTPQRMPEFIEAGTALALRLVPGARVVAYGHLGDGNVHFNLSAPQGADPDAFAGKAPEVRRAIHDLVASRGGSFSAEHGIGQLKVGELERYESPVALDLMRRIKCAIDPHGIMNPGKVLRISRDEGGAD